jgi:predicted nucleic-acid-binding Zn-ribbon protein
MEILLIIVGIWVAIHIFDWWQQRPHPKTPEQLLQAQREREQRERERQTRLEQQRIEREQQEREESARLEQQRIEWERKKAEQREEWLAAYEKYLRSEKWKEVRQRVFKRSGYKCEFCGRQAEEVHHVRYPKGFRRKIFKRENIRYLKAICRKCHERLHGTHPELPLFRL